jgi:hypothetical protein
MLHSKNHAELTKHITNAKNRLDHREGTVLWNFLKNQRLYCFASIESENFVGFTSSSSIN